MILVAQGSLVLLGFLFLCALAATGASLLSVALSFSSVRRRWYVPLLAFPSFVFGVALTILWFTASGSSVVFLLASGANLLFGTVGIARWVLNQAR